VPTIRERTDEQSLAARLASESGTNHLVPVATALTLRAEAAEPAPTEE
jgi:hypothetical protein